MVTSSTKKKTSPRKRGKSSKKNENSTRKLGYICISIIVLVVVIFLAFVYRSYFNPYSFRLKALFGVVKYPDGKVRGIDVSHYQDEINWEKLRNAQLQGTPVNFIFVKATEGSDRLDENFNQNFFHARRNGIMRGAYHFFSTQSSAKTQAKYFCKMVQLDEEDLPPVLDVE
jgi:lysozyme